MPSDALPLRIDRFLRQSLGLPTRRSHPLIASGAVELLPAEAPGAPITMAFPDTLVLPGDRVLVAGTEAERRPVGAVMMLHKPAGVVTTMSDPQGRPCVADLISTIPGDLAPIGRLDAETTGLLLLTDDGDLAHLLLHPRHHAEKAYLLTVQGDVPADDPRLLALARGVTLRDGPAQASDLRAEPGGDGQTAVHLVVREGRKHLVRRLARAVGLDLVHLHRTRVGAISLGELPEGAIAPLSARELADLWHPFGGREAVHEAQRHALRARAERRRAEGRPLPRLETWLSRASR